MPLRRRAWLTREGWYYLAILTFIIGGAVLRSINLLVVLAGMLIAPLLFNWRLVMASLMGLAVRRRLPAQIIAGEPLIVEIEIENPRRWMSSWLIVVEDWIEQQRVSGRKSEVRVPRPLRRERRTRAEALIGHVPAGGRAIGTYRITLHRRGRYRVGPLRVSTRFPLGLVRGQVSIRDQHELIVAPRIGRLLPAWSEMLEAELIGDRQRQPQRGISEGDYYGLRPWQRGDSLRWMHWRSTAKLGRPIVRQFERHKSRDVAIVLDPWLPAVATQADEGFLELAISLAATAISDMTSRSQGRLTVTIAGSPPQCYSGPASLAFCDELFTALADLQGTFQYSLGVALDQAVQRGTNDAHVLVVSPRAADDPSLGEVAAEIPLDPDDLSWIHTGSERLQEIFRLD
jgi:uncharacterized protein (DUF58 family)